MDETRRIDITHFPLKHEVFVRKQELGERLVRLRYEARGAAKHRHRVVAAFVSCAVAAAVLFVVFALRVSTIVGGGSVTLPCGSVVAVGQGGEVKYMPFLWHIGHREVELATGSARFSVMPGDGRFSVKTKFGCVSVLGTEFEILQEDEVTTTVRCFRGKVAVEVDDAVPVEVEAGEETVVTDNVVAPVRALTDDDNGKANDDNDKAEVITYDNAPLATVVEEMEKRFGIKIEGKQLCVGITYSGIFYAGDKDLTLKVVFGACGLDYTVDDDKVTLGKSK